MDIVAISQSVIALVAVLALMGLAAFAARRFGLAPGGGSSPARRRRLAVVETLGVDARTRAVILRCDGREHLVLLGAAGATLVEAGLPAQPAGAPAGPSAD